MDVLCPIRSSASRDRPLMRNEPESRMAGGTPPLDGILSHPYVFHIGSSRPSPLLVVRSPQPGGRGAEASRLGRSARPASAQPPRRPEAQGEARSAARKSCKVQGWKGRTGLPPRSATRVEMTLVDVTGGEIQILLIPRGTQIQYQILRTACTQERCGRICIESNSFEVMCWRTAVPTQLRINRLLHLSRQWIAPPSLSCLCASSRT